MSSFLYIDEYLQGTQLPVGELMQCPLEPPIASQKVDFTSGEAKSAAFNVLTAFVAIHADSVCSVLFGAAPTATTSNRRMAAGQTDYRGVPVGNGAALKLSVIANT